MAVIYAIAPSKNWYSVASGHTGTQHSWEQTRQLMMMFIFTLTWPAIYHDTLLSGAQFHFRNYLLRLYSHYFEIKIVTNVELFNVIIKATRLVSVC